MTVPKSDEANVMREIETLMDDESWVLAAGIKDGEGPSDYIGGDGWMLCVYEDLRFWAAPDEWRSRTQLNVRAR